MSNETTNEKGFLFEIEDYNYLLHRFCLWFMVLIVFLFILLYYHNGNILELRNSNHEGYLIATMGGMYLIFEGIKMLIYILGNKKEKLQFYTTYIYRTSMNLKIPLENIEEGYISKYNTFPHRVPWRISNFMTLLAIILGGFVVLILIPTGRFLYSCFKGKRYTFETNNLLLLQNNYNKYCFSIALNIASKEEVFKLNQYLNQYLNTDINKLDRILYKIPEFKRNNL